jgi:CheY-like chemotaxis protein
MTTVLIVDDSKLARIVAGKRLIALQQHWERVEAGNAEEAIAVFNTRKIDVVLIDYNMPGKDGMELAIELRAIDPRVPIAIVTANIQDEIISRARAINATFVAKPVTEETLQGFIAGAALRLRTENK